MHMHKMKNYKTSTCTVH